MSQAEYRELAARYNGGPYYQSDPAVRYGSEFEQNLPKARSAMR